MISGFLLACLVASCGGDGLADAVRAASATASTDGSERSAETTAAGDPDPTSPGVGVPITEVPGVELPAPATVPPVDPAAGDLIRFTPVSFIDPASGGVTAISVLVPDGWQASGSVQWLPEWSRLAFLQTRVYDPATGITLDYLPIQDFISFTPPAGFEVPIGGNYQGKAFVPPITDPVEFVRQFWMSSDLSHLADATLVSVIEVPEIAADFVTRFGAPAEAHAYRMRYEYLSNGQPWEQDVSFALLYAGSEPMLWYVNYAYTVGGPKGELDRNAGTISAIYASRITTPEWEANYRLVQDLFRQGIRTQMADTVRFGELLAQYRAESAALQQQVIDERWASQDRQAEVFRDTLGGVQTYGDPVNGTLVQLPLGWSTYWVNEQGEYLATDQGFDPNTLNDGTWQQLDPVA